MKILSFWGRPFLVHKLCGFPFLCQLFCLTRSFCKLSGHECAVLWGKAGFIPCGVANGVGRTRFSQSLVIGEKEWMYWGRGHFVPRRTCFNLVKHSLGLTDLILLYRKITRTSTKTEAEEGEHALLLMSNKELHLCTPSGKPNERRGSSYQSLCSHGCLTANAEIATYKQHLFLA